MTFPDGARMERAAATQTVPTDAAPAKRSFYRPGIRELAITLVVGVIVLGVAFLLQSGQGRQDHLTTSRIAGFITYGVLSVSVAVGLYLSLRDYQHAPTYFLAERVHPQLMFALVVLLILHIRSLTLNGFPVDQSVIPSHRPTIAFGAVSMWLGLTLILSTCGMRFIGFRVWRIMHYCGLMAWLLALIHGLVAGADTGKLLTTAVYVAGALLVGAFAAVRVMRSSATWQDAVGIERRAAP